MYIDAIKAAARISHTVLDKDIERMEAYALEEMKRVGVPEFALTVYNKLIQNAVVMYAMSELQPDKYEKYREAWEYQLDNLRKHVWEE